MGGARPYLLHGENLFGGSSMLEQTVELHLRPDLRVQTGDSQSDRETAMPTVRQEVSVTHQLVVVGGVGAGLSVS